MLNPDVEAVKKDFALFVTSQASVTAWSHAILATELPSFDPKPDWYDNLNSIFDAIRKEATSWVDELGPRISGGTPQSLIDFADAVGPAASELAPLVQMIIRDQGGQPDGDQVTEIRGILEGLRAKAAAAEKKVETADTAFQDFLASLTSGLHRLEGGSTAISADLQVDQAKIQALHEKIEQIRQKIAADSQKATSGTVSAVFIVIGLVIVLAGVVASEGALLPLLGLGFGVVNFGRVVGQDVVWSEDVQKDFDDLFEQLRALNAVERQVATLKAIEASVNGLLTATSQANDTLPRFETVWDVLGANLDCTLEILRQPTVDLRRVPELSSIGKAAEDWKEISTVADNVQRSFMNIKSASMKIPPEDSDGS